MERLPACFQLQTGNNQELGNCKYNTSVLTVSLGTGVSGVPCQDPRRICHFLSLNGFKTTLFTLALPVELKQTINNAFKLDH